LTQAVLAAEEYARRLRSRQSRVAEYEKVHIRLGNVRLALALAAVVMGWAALGRHALSLWWLLAPAAIFFAVAVYHSRVLRLRDLAQRAVSFYENGLARIEDRWSSIGETGERFLDPHHPYGADLDLFGKGSLFQLLSAARTRMGEERLAQWLLRPSPVEAIRQRHAAASELRDQLDFREDLAVLGADAGVGLYPHELLKWAEAPNQLQSRWIPAVARLLVGLMLAGAFVYAYWDVITPLVLIVIIESSLALALRKKIEETLHSTEHVFRNLDLLAGILERVDRQQFHVPPLQALQQALTSGGVAAWRAVAKLRGLVDFIDSRDNVFVRVLDVPFMYSVQVAFAAERWRAKHGGALRAWLNAVAEIEALLSLAAYSFEHPADPFPEWSEGAARFEAQQLAHPLLPAAVCVRNSLRISSVESVLLVSGSNMSGKSTLLRAVGVNAVLAMAGAPVRAERLQLTPLQVGASIRINDSLQEGSSRFYAEITRLRQILDLAAEPPPVLFLLDELLQGTNSKDRRIGAEGVIVALVNRGAVGLISTHDLALTEMDGSVSSRLHNVHFQDDLEDGRMKFDYRLREGVITKSNGLELMRSIGLQV
jgi:hypothetical protein